MTSTEAILAKILESFIENAERGSFAGIVGYKLLILGDSEDQTRQRLSALVEDGSVSCVFSKYDENMHIKRFPDLPINQQLPLLETEKLTSFCAYPTAKEVSRVIDLTDWSDRPFSQELLLTAPQLSYRAFDMGAMERYTADPRYIIRFSDYMGSMSIRDEHFLDDQYMQRDKVSLQDFGLGFNQQHTPHIVVFLRYLAQLSPEHQQYWKSYLAPDDVRMCEQYFKSSILGEFWDNTSVRYAIVEEMKFINVLSEHIWGAPLFKNLPEKDVPIGLTSFLRPTRENYNKFVSTLDKLLSEKLNYNFFAGKVALEEEKTRSDGKIEVTRKGSLKLLEEWLSSVVNWEDIQQFQQVIISPLKKIRKLRQPVAHSLTPDDYDKGYYNARKQLLWDVYNSLSNIRRTFVRHPRASGIKVPKCLDSANIDVF